jgi:hypothetical protein
VRPLEEKLADGQDEIVERIAYQLSAYRPCGSTALGPAEVTQQVSLLVGGLIESLRARRVAPFVDSVRASFADVQDGERFAFAELHMVLDLLEDLVLQSLGGPAGPPRDVTAAIRKLVDAGREIVPRDTKLEP